MKLTSTTTLLIMALVSSVPAAASEIYKYTDPDGTVRYADRPTGEPSEEKVAIVSSRTDPVQVQGRMQSFSESRASAEEAAQARADERRAGEQAASEREQRAKQCEMYRARLETYLQSRRLYREDANGERIYLDEKETLEARRKVEDLIAETCDA